MQEKELRRLLKEFHAGLISEEDAIERLRTLPFEDFAEVCFDTHREIRCGVGEIVYGEGKSCQQLYELLQSLAAKGQEVCVTRLTPEQMQLVEEKFPALICVRQARLARSRNRARDGSLGRLGIVTAGTSDVPVGEEVRHTAEFFGLEVQCFWDLGVAGLQRILTVVEQLQRFDVLVVVAGMEGTLPGVVAGLVRVPVIGVPTSVGYGVATGGRAALCSMLASCSLGLSVVNIDNGVGAAAVAAKQMLSRRRERAD